MGNFKKYTYNRERGICTECGASMAEPGMVRCKNCREKHKEDHKERYWFYSKLGICVSCGRRKAEPGKKRCFECLEKRRAYDRERYAPQKKREYLKRRKELYQLHKSQKICVCCRKPATHGMHCYEHSIKRRRISMARANEAKWQRHERGLIPEIRKEEGLCLWCGEPAATGVVYCTRHGQMFSEYGKIGKQMSPWANGW